MQDAALEDAFDTAVQNLSQQLNLKNIPISKSSSRYEETAMSAFSDKSPGFYIAHYCKEEAMDHRPVRTSEQKWITLLTAVAKINAQ